MKKNKNINKVEELYKFLNSYARLMIIVGVLMSFSIVIKLFSEISIASQELEKMSLSLADIGLGALFQAFAPFIFYLVLGASYIIFGLKLKKNSKTPYKKVKRWSIFVLISSIICVRGLFAIIALCDSIVYLAKWSKVHKNTDELVEKQSVI